MFGYIVPNHMELKVREYEEYRGYYCGLCVCLKNKFGLWGRFALNYDLVFLSLLLTALYAQPEDVIFEKHFCPLHPMRKHVVRKSEPALYAADMNIVLSYYKCIDDWNDERNFVRFVYAGVLKGKLKKIEKRYPEKINTVRKFLEKLSVSEKDNEKNPDAVSGCFGEICRCIFVYHDDDEWADALGDLGFYIGKFIYLLDAFEDVEDDIKKGRYNVFASKYKTLPSEEFKKWVREILEIVIAQAGRIFERLPIVDNTEILRNIIYSGIWSRFGSVS